MKLIILVPKVVQNYVSQFPEVTNNAYKYFNYDNRVVEERVDRQDQKAPYKGPEQFCDEDYDSLVTYAKTLVNPILAKYSSRVACEDALHMAIRDFSGGLFDGKVNANRYNVLLKVMSLPATVMAGKKKEAPEPSKVPTRVLKQLGLTTKDIPRQKHIRQRIRAPHLVRTDEGTVIQKS